MGNPRRQKAVGDCEATVGAGLRLISDVEIREHKNSYKYSDISAVLQQSGFRKSELRFGSFELFMNTWVTARK